MIINLNKLPVTINESLEIPESFYENGEIKGLKDVKVTGFIKYNAIDEVVIDLSVNGIMLLNDAVTNELVEYPFTTKIEEEIAENDEEIRKYYEKRQNTLDIIELLWENIILEVPIRFTKEPDALLSGDGWQLNCWEDKEQTDSRFAKLNDIFKGGE